MGKLKVLARCDSNCIAEFRDEKGAMQVQYMGRVPHIPGIRVASDLYVDITVDTDTGIIEGFETKNDQWLVAHLRRLRNDVEHANLEAFVRGYAQRRFRERTVDDPDLLNVERDVVLREIAKRVDEIEHLLNTPLDLKPDA